MQWFFLGAAIVGTILPLRFLLPFLVTNGPDLNLFFQQMFHNNVSAFFGVTLSFRRWHCGFLYFQKDGDGGWASCGSM